MAWADIKTYVQVNYGQYVGNGKLIDDSGSPSPLAILFDMVHNRISGSPQTEWPFLKETGTISLTGAASYNLATLLPGIRSVYQIYGINQNQDSTPLSNYEANITPIDSAHTLRNKTLVFTGSSPSGTATVQYKSFYMVKDASGNRKRYFEDDTDVTVLDDADMNVLIFGIGEYINWSSDTLSQERRDEVRAWFKEAWENMRDTNEQSHQITSML